MAEMVVALIGQLISVFKKEAKLLGGIDKEIADMEDELECIQAVLKNVDQRAEGDNPNEVFKTWVKQVREADFRMQDVIDDYMILVGPQPRDRGCVPLLYKIGHSLRNLTPQHRIASEIQDIKSFVSRVWETRERYGFQTQPSIVQGSRMDSLYIDEAEIVGFDAPKNKLIEWLVKGRSELTVIFVVGMGGQGKTTLAKTVFDSREVVGHFECHVWITVSQSYNIEVLLTRMLKELYKQKGDDPPQDITEMDRGALISTLRKYLLKKRYVFVFDDVWNIPFWNEIKNALIDNKDGSKIFITTRNMDVAVWCKKSSSVEVHELQPLTNEQSFELLNKKVFRNKKAFPKEFSDISLEIAKKCNGLPLALVAIGGLLLTKKKNVSEWQRLCDHMPYELKKNSHLIGIKKILAFSYDDLPPHLKSCLLYFAIYPEDYNVGSKRLFRQWAAEGFVTEANEYTSLEEIAEGYLTELISRSLVQVSSVRIDGKSKSCHVHDLTRVMILEKCEDLSFCKHISGDDNLSFFGIIRRLSISTHSCNVFDRTDQNSHVRSLFLFTNDSSKFMDEHFVKRILTEYRRLKVLDFEGALISNLKENMGSLIHLKYLSFEGSVVKKAQDEFLKSIGLLQNMETLDLKADHNFILMKPIEISQL